MNDIKDDFELIAIDELVVENLPESNALASISTVASAGSASCPATAGTASSAGTLSC